MDEVITKGDVAAFLGWGFLVFLGFVAFFAICAFVNKMYEH